MSFLKDFEYRREFDSVLKDDLWTPLKDKFSFLGRILLFEMVAFSYVFSTQGIPVHLSLSYRVHGNFYSLPLSLKFKNMLSETWIPVSSCDNAGKSYLIMHYCIIE